MRIMYSRVEKNEVKDCLYPPEPSDFQMITKERKENIYESSRKMKLGECPEFVAVPPALVNSCFGRPVTESQSIKNLLYPLDFDTSLYNSTYNTLHTCNALKGSVCVEKAGVAVKADETGGNTRELMQWHHPRFHDASFLIAKAQEEKKKELEEYVRDLISDSEGHCHQLDVQKRPFRLIDPFKTPKKNFRSKAGIVSMVWNLIKMKNHHHFSCLESAFNKYDRSKSGKISAEDIDAICKLFNLSVSFEVIEEILNVCDRDKDGFLNFEEFCYFLNWKDKMPLKRDSEGIEFECGTSHLQDNNVIPLKALDAYETTSSSFGPHDLKCTENTMFAGTRTVRVDLPIPKLRGLGNVVNYGDASGISSIIEPTVFNRHGVHEIDLITPREKEEVQGTNDSSVLSKLSAANKGYYNDGFLKYFCIKSQRRTSLINRGYYIRFKAIETVFQSWFEILHDLSLENCQVISLGAGFDTSYFRFKEDKKLKKGFKYIEVDFPEVVTRKKNSVMGHENLRKLLYTEDNNAVNIFSTVPEIALFHQDYILLGLDLKELERLEEIFTDIELDFNIPTLFFSECAITYMDVDRSDQLIAWAKEKFANSAFVTYEQVYPQDGFGLVMQNHFRNLGSPLKSVKRYPDLKSQRSRFLKLGWPKCCVKGMNSVWASLPQEEKNRVCDLELFDEYETWHQKCSHYVLVWASQGLINFCTVGKEIDSVSEIKSFSSVELSKQATVFPVYRYGHQAVMLGDSLFLITGGFGHCNEKHQRLTGLTCGNIITGSISEVILEDSQKLLGARMHHSMVMLKENNIFIYGGRSAPNKPYDCSVLLIPIKLTTDKVSEPLPSDVHNGHLSFFCKNIEESGTIPESRWRHSSNSFILNNTEHVFIFGGCTVENRATDDCYVLNTAMWTWSKVLRQKQTPFPRHSHSSAADSSNHIIVTGGLTHNEKVLNTVHSFNINTWSWEILDVKGLLPRFSHTSHVFQGKLFLVGGVSSIGGIFPYIAVIDLVTFNTTEILMPGQDPEYPVLLHNHASVLYEDQLILIGGGGNCFSFGTHFNGLLSSINLTNLL